MPKTCRDQSCLILLCCCGVQEFIDFVGEERSVMGGDKAATLQHKCVWATTCNKVRQWG